MSPSPSFFLLLYNCGSAFSAFSVESFYVCVCGVFLTDFGEILQMGKRGLVIGPLAWRPAQTTFLPPLTSSQARIRREYLEWDEWTVK